MKVPCVFALSSLRGLFVQGLFLIDVMHCHAAAQANQGHMQLSHGFGCPILLEDLPEGYELPYQEALGPLHTCEVSHWLPKTPFACQCL